MHLHVIRALSTQLFEVDLITNNCDSSISLREAFLYTGLARERNVVGAPLMPQSQQLLALEQHRLPKYVPRVGDVLMIQMLHVEQPQEFYVMPHELEPKRHELQRELQCFMDHMSLSKLEPIYLGRLEMGCVVQSEGQWHRASIQHILPKGEWLANQLMTSLIYIYHVSCDAIAGYVLVRLVDSGITQKLYWDQLFMLPRIFWIQESAIQCCLADVEPLQANGYAWTTDAIDAFKQLTSNPKLQMEVVSVHNKVANVALYYGNHHVAATLVSQGHCESTGLSSKVIKPQHTRFSQFYVDTRKLMDEVKEEPLDAAPQPKQTDNTNRSPIEMLHVQHPGEFYVTLAHFVSAIAELRKTVQATAAEKYQSCNRASANWKRGDMCYVRVKAKGDQELLWHRGQIVECINSNTISKYDVRLRDIGELVLDVPSRCLVEMDEALERISNSAVCCRLFGVVPNGDDWSDQAKAYFKSQLEIYSSLHVTGYGRSGDCLDVILWGARTEISGPFSPARTKYTNINEMLLQEGHATRVPQMLVKEEAESTSSSCSSSSKCSLCSKHSCHQAMLKGFGIGKWECKY